MINGQRNERKKGKIDSYSGPVLGNCPSRVRTFSINLLYRSNQEFLNVNSLSLALPKVTGSAAMENWSSEYIELEFERVKVICTCTHACLVNIAFEQVKWKCREGKGSLQIKIDGKSP